MTAVEEKLQQSGYSENFWVSSSPFFSSTLIIRGLVENNVPDAAVPDPVVPDGALEADNNLPARKALAPAKLHITLYDPDGHVFNQLELDFGLKAIGLIDLEPCMAECKFESGMKHARLKLESTVPVHAIIRLHTRDWTVVSDCAKPLGSQSRYLVPLESSIEKTTWVVAMNDSDSELELKLRLFLGRRSPETVLRVPALGVGVFDTKLLFSEVFEQNHEELPAYIRLSIVESKSSEISNNRKDSSIPASIFVQCLDLPVSSKQARFFSVFR